MRPRRSRGSSMQGGILGQQLEGVLTGVRQLRRTQPLETEVFEALRVPTVGEMAHLQAWLLLTRHTVRDDLDTVVLLERLEESGVRGAMQTLDTIYAQPGGASQVRGLGGNRLHDPTRRP